MKPKRILKKLVLVLVCLCLVLGLLAASAVLLRYRILAAYMGIGQPIYGKMLEEMDVMVPMRDGVQLATDVYRPDAPGKFPALVMRLPYGKNAARGGEYYGVSLSPAMLFTQRGYALIIQDTRGRYDSEGTYYAFRGEGPDGEDLLKWLDTQPWFNGEAGGIGASYFGYTQWAMAPFGGSRLKCIAPMVISAELHSLLYRGGALNLETLAGWVPGTGHRRGGDTPAEFDKRHLPLLEMDDAAGTEFEFFNDWLTHYTKDAYWATLDYRKEFPKVTAPALFVTGWYDFGLGPQLTDFEIIQETGGSPEAKNPRLLVGPWSHGGLVGEHASLGGEADLLKNIHAIFDWNDYWLRDLGTLPEKPVKIFVMGINQWREEETWPLERAQDTPYYLHSAGTANTAAGDGTLDTLACADGEATDNFTYDPEDPVPTNGGCFLGGGMGPRNQQSTEARADVLVYTSAPLTAPLEVTGPVRLTLHAATTGTDTDFVAKLCDVHPDGKSVNVAQGVQRGRFLEEGKEQPMTPGEIYPFDIDLWATSNVFLEGHRIRVLVTSSDFPQFDRNLNLYGPFAQQTEFQKAAQTIYHDAAHPSYIVLPVVPD